MKREESRHEMEAATEKTKRKKERLETKKAIKRTKRDEKGETITSYTEGEEEDSNAIGDGWRPDTKSKKKGKKANKEGFKAQKKLEDGRKKLIRKI